jgi:hypothetical protein
MDIKKACDRVNRGNLITKLSKLGFKGKPISFMNELIRPLAQRILYKIDMSTEYHTNHEIPQDGVLSCILWNLYFYDILDKVLMVQNNTIPVFAGVFTNYLEFVVSTKASKVGGRQL